MRCVLRIALLAACFLLTYLPVLYALEAPPLVGRVNDHATMLSPAAVKNIEARLAAFEQATTNQIVVLTVPSLEGDTIEGFAIKVAEAWKPGQQGKDNGILLVLAKKERKIRIEVGKGLQGALPDITSGQIIRNVIAPHLRSGNIDQGISAGVGALIDATKGEFKASTTDRKAMKKKKSGYGFFIVLLLLALGATAVAGSSSRTAGAIAGSISLPTAAGIGLGAALSKLALLAVLGGIAGILISLLMRLFNSSGGSGGGYHGGGWGGPPIFYGGGGGSSSDDGFSGGGGDFDGGGASDDW